MKKEFYIKCFSVFVCINLLTQIFYPTIALALTGGPSQPEMQDFTPIGTTDMVDLSSGSFTYNIPLMDVDGYPINLSYHSGVTMDQEASWVGLGWNINPGEINRQMRGLPDDFNGDKVTKQFNIKDNVTVGINAGAGFELFGVPAISLNANVGIFYNNYTGPGVSLGASPSISAGISAKGTLTASLGLNLNSQSGFDVTPGIGFSEETSKDEHNETDVGMTVGVPINSRSGVKGVVMTKDLNSKSSKTDEDGKSISGSISASNSSTVSFASPTYAPSIAMPVNNHSYTLHFTTGLALFGAHPNVTFSGYANIQSLATNNLSLPAYGYMYSDYSAGNPSVLLDFNREKDVPFQPHIANLPITNFTYDLFNVSGQGVSGQYRTYRGDVGILYDHLSVERSESFSLGLELGAGFGFHDGVDVGATFASTTTDQWNQDNYFAQAVKFQGIQPNNMNYEPYYFKGVGEKTVNDQNYYNKILDTQPMSVFLDPPFGAASNLLSYNNGNSLRALNFNPTKTRREKRGQVISLLTSNEANYFALDKTINSYPYNKNVYDSLCSGTPAITKTSRLIWPNHHISEITVTKADGKRYVYGIPAYNTLQNEATFAIARPSSITGYSNDSTNLAAYTGSDNSTGNTKGIDNYFSEQSMPAYSHSFLLTGVLSPDYVDRTGDGITDDDMGQAVKINYTQIYNKAHPYRWRTPIEQNTATYQEGFKSDATHDKGNYIYGEKEIWYVHSIESKTMVAQFILENREDGLGVLSENGGKDITQHLQRLKEIRLYSKADLIKNGSKAIPIKTVHFVYTYNLCQGVPNSATNQGKLTLTQVYFTYGNNTEGSLNSYQFGYSSFNPSYSHIHYDRWGFYKDNPSGIPPNSDFPYTLQDSIRSNLFATAWELTDIHLPSGGNIKVHYQANDYAYVQNQRAGQMFLVEGLNSSADSSGMVQNLYQKSGGGFTSNDWLIVKLPTPITSRADFYNKYLDGVYTGNNKLYFRFLVDMDGNGHYEYVPGYADIADYQRIDATTGAIQLKEVSTGNSIVPSISPIALAAWQYARLNLPEYAYPGSNTTGSVLHMATALVGIVSEVIQIFTGFDALAAARGLGKNTIPVLSYIRFDNPNYKKLGGGCRVSEMDISDNWANMASGQSSFSYGQTYNYTTTLNGQLNGQIISSGVATYEPILGSDENPLRQPLPYSENLILAPNNSYYTETPLGESLYPSPEVVYSKVTVKNLSFPHVRRTATGYTVNEFYTAKDFPVINTPTSMQVERVKPSVLSALFSFGVEDYTTASQGFTVETNDMAGKQKSQKIYDENKALISSVSYHYKVDNDAAPSLHLNNDVDVIKPDGSIAVESIGKDIDVWEDMREQVSHTFGLDAQVQFDLIILPFFAIPVPTVYPSYSSEKTRFRSSVTTKYIHRTGILDKITKTQNGSTVSTENLLYDGETGDVLLTKSNNEFEAPVYSFTYPAHWAYDGMGSAYRNIGAIVSNITVSAGVMSVSHPDLYFTPGDEVEAFPGTNVNVFAAPNANKYWIAKPQSNLVLINNLGKPVTSTTPVTLKVIRSGRRNMPGTPIGSIVSLLSPEGANSLKVNDSLQILQANATLFNQSWKIPTNNILVDTCRPVDAIIPASCMAQLIDSLIVHNQLFVTPEDSLNITKYFGVNNPCGKYLSQFLYDNPYYYALQSAQGYDQMANFSAQLGNCTMTISSLNGKPVYLDSLTPYNYLNNHDSVSSSGCIYLFKTAYTAGGKKGRKTADFILPASPPNPPVAEVCFSCFTCHPYCVNIDINKYFNPYAEGMLGNWRPERSYVYYDNRNPAFTAPKTDIWKNGTFKNFSSIWNRSYSDTIPWALDTLDKNWTWTGRITMYDVKGSEIENVDALGRYSSALYGYLESLPTAVASNAKYREIAFDGFEDYGFTNSCGTTCDNSHFSFISSLGSSVDTTSLVSHTGKYSLQVSPNNTASVERAINYYNNKLDSTTANEYLMLNGADIPLFSPDAGKYLVSAWVKENVLCGVTGYTADSVEISFNGSTLKYAFSPSGPVIEGWQRFSSNFTVPSTATAIFVKLHSGNHTAYFDDIRLQPFQAEMKTYVYDPSNLRLVSTLDENNYATIYEYNDEGILMRVKKETERGIMTIKETRSSYLRP